MAPAPIGYRAQKIEYLAGIRRNYPHKLHVQPPVKDAFTSIAISLKLKDKGGAPAVARVQHLGFDIRLICGEKLSTFSISNVNNSFRIKSLSTKGSIALEQGDPLIMELKGAQHKFPGVAVTNEGYGIFRIECLHEFAALVVHAESTISTASFESTYIKNSPVLKEVMKKWFGPSSNVERNSPFPPFKRVPVEAHTVYLSKKDCSLHASDDVDPFFKHSFYELELYFVENDKNEKVLAGRIVAPEKEVPSIYKDYFAYLLAQPVLAF